MKNTDWLYNHGIHVSERTIPVSPTEQVRQIVFNMTNINYMQLVNENEWNEKELVFIASSGNKIVTEHHSIYIRYRTEEALFTLFRFNRPANIYYGETLKIFISQYFGTDFYNEEEVFASGKIEEFVPSFVAGDGYNKKAYYYKAFDGKHLSSIPVFSSCPFKMKKENYSIIKDQDGRPQIAGTCEDCPYHEHDIVEKGMSVCRISPIIR